MLCPGAVQTQIMYADRNRPDEFGGTGERSAGEAAAFDAFLASGIDPANVADLVLQSIIEERCYILPHPDWDDIVRQRVENILARTVPAARIPRE